MKKIFSFVAAALMSVSMFAFDGPVPADSDLDFEAGKLTVAIHFSKVCGDVYFVGTYNNWAKGEGSVESFDNCQKFKAVEGFDGWYQIQIEDESESIEGKPVHTTPDGAWSWDYQTGDAASWELIRGTVNISGGYSGESDLKGYDKTTPVVLVSNAWKNDPCSIVYANYHIVVDAPLCGGFAPMLIGGFDGWKGTPMKADEANFNYYLNIRTAVGGEFKIVAVPTDGGDPWANELQYKDSTGAWANFANQVLPDGETDPIVVNLDYSDETKYRYAKCAVALDYDIYLKAPAMCQDITPAIVGSATPGGWDAGTEMTWVSENTWYIKLEAAQGEYKFYDLNLGWENEIQMLNPETGEWGGTPNLTLGDETTVTIDYSDAATYRWKMCEATGIAEVKAAIKNDGKYFINGTLYIKKGDKLVNVLGL
ncbi:MAG: hypothetical protein MJZ79_03840 [Paludibacteraceae bacterium]|nr:hypothetical protein [Paludibacteraceae bacterium]